jgi:hypothetical protein
MGCNRVIAALSKDGQTTINQTMENLLLRW